MQRTKMTEPKLSKQVELKHQKPVEGSAAPLLDGNSAIMVSTGSTLLDLAIAGGRARGGGIPTGILVEIFGPSGTGKTVLLCQLAGNIQRVGGKVLFHDPEARLDKQFARMFGLDAGAIEYTRPNTVGEMFAVIRKWMPKADGGDQPRLHGIFADSLAALSTEMEMEKDEGDKMGMRRAKEFSEELRKTCRHLAQENILMVCSNQVRQNLDAGPYGQKYLSPGGEALGFYASLRLRCVGASKLKVKREVRGREIERVIGVKTTLEVFKSSVWKPHRDAEVYILYNYGIDDIRGNLVFYKTITGDTTYKLGERKLGKSLEQAIQAVEEEGLEQELRGAVIDLWEEVESQFSDERKPRVW